MLFKVMYAQFYLVRC